MSDYQDIGHGFAIARALRADGTLGAIELRCAHYGQDQRQGQWSIPLLPDARGWTLLSEDPLTLSPSVHCVSCGCHGWIRDGKWVPG